MVMVMLEMNEIIINMISQNATVNEILEATGLSNRQLSYRLNLLKMKAYNFSKKYYYNGEVVYKIKKDFTKEKDISIITSKEDTNFEAVFISDLHLAGKYERIDLLNQVYDFCVKEGIHIIVNCGDLLDGFLGKYDDKKYYSANEQIEHLLKNYPYDKNILNFTCLGNHDYSILETTGQNLENILLNYRHDIVPLGYGLGGIRVKNDIIMVRHPKTKISNSGGSINEGFIVSGHTHQAKNISDKNLLSIYLPPLSDLLIDKDTLPGFVRGNISFSGGYFCHGSFQHYVFFDRMYKINEYSYNLYSKNKDKTKGIDNEEERFTCHQKVLVK